jgi:hypothetical protein
MVVFQGVGEVWAVTNRLHQILNQANFFMQYSRHDITNVLARVTCDSLQSGLQLCVKIDRNPELGLSCGGTYPWSR